jgi:hypothetical protein
MVSSAVAATLILLQQTLVKCRVNEASGTLEGLRNYIGSHCIDKGFSVPCIAHYCRELRPG